MIAIRAGCMKLIYVEIQKRKSNENNNNSATNSNNTIAQCVTQCCNCFGLNEQLFTQTSEWYTPVRRCTLHFRTLVYFIFSDCSSKTNVEWFHPNDRCSFAHLFATWKVNKCGKLRIKTQRERTPLSVLIANFVYTPHFSSASSFSMSNNILSLDCALFFALLSFGLATYFAMRPLHLFFPFACTIHRIIFMELVLLMNWQNIKNASIIFCLFCHFISFFPGIYYTEATQLCRMSSTERKEKFELENCRK